MVFWALLLALLVLALACCSLYCRLRKSRSEVFSAPAEAAAADSVVEAAPAASESATPAPAPAPATPSFASRVKGRLLRFADDVTYLLGRLTGYIPSHTVRMFLYRHVFMMDLGPGTTIHFGLEVRAPWNFRCGRGCIIGDKAVFDARCGIEFGDYVNLSTGCWIWTLQHDVNSPTFGTEGQGGAVRVGQRAWLSNRTTILPGKTIAEGVVLAAGAVLTKSAPDEFTIWGGGPCQVHWQAQPGSDLRVHRQGPPAVRVAMAA